MKAFTYLIIDNINQKWYYGVRYARGCRTTDMLSTYFTSSKFVKAAIQKYGIENFSYTIRRVFDNINAALEWEQKVLRRMRVVGRADCYNLAIGGKFPIYTEEHKQFVSDATKKKLSAIRLGKSVSNHQQRTIKIAAQKRGLVRWIIRNRKAKILKKYKVSRLLNYIDYIDTNNKKLARTRAFIVNYIENILPTIEKKAPGRKRGKQYPLSNETKKKISTANSRKVHYTSPDGTEHVVIDESSDPPIGWIRGIKNKDRSDRIRETSTGRLHDSKTKLLLSENAKRKIYFTSPDFLVLIAVYSIDDAPDGWIRGNKLKSRNDKITKYLNEVRYNENREN